MMGITVGAIRVFCRGVTEPCVIHVGTQRVTYERLDLGKNRCNRGLCGRISRENMVMALTIGLNIQGTVCFPYA